MEERRAERLAMNETLFRDVNEMLVKEQGDRAGERTTFVCECARMNCQLRLSLTPDEYASVREHAGRFIVFPGHEVSDIEVTVGGDPQRYRVVEKTEPGRSVAES